MMTTLNQNVTAFLTKMGILPELTDISKAADAFRQEMCTGLKGQGSDLAMIPSFIGNSFSYDDAETVIAIDAGGTNLRISLIRLYTEKLPEILKIKHFPMPGTKEPVTSDAVFDFLAQELEEFLSCTSKIGFCFSYAVEILPSRDGRILALGKEVTIHNIKGKRIGEELNKALARKNLPSISHLTVLNDTTAALIGGQFLCREHTYSDFIGYILGTGTNICYYEKNNHILKVPELTSKKGRTIINTESGYFDHHFRGILDTEFWAETLNPEDHHLEKMVSGQYLGKLLSRYLAKAADAHLFSKEASDLIFSLKEIRTKQINDYLTAASPENPLEAFRHMEPSDTRVFDLLTDALLERAARLVTATMAGCLLQTGSGRDADRPVLILMEGSTFVRFTRLKEKILHYVDTEITEKLGIHVVLKELDNAVTYGTAFSATAL